MLRSFVGRTVAALPLAGKWMKERFGPTTQELSTIVSFSLDRFYFCDMELVPSDHVRFNLRSAERTVRNMLSLMPCLTTPCPSLRLPFQYLLHRRHHRRRRRHPTDVRSASPPPVPVAAVADVVWTR